MEKQTLTVGVATLVAGLLVGAIAGSSLTRQGVQKSVDDPSGSPGAKGTYALNVIASTIPFWNESKLSFESAGKRAGAKTVFGGPPDTDPQKQIEELRTLKEGGLSGLVIAPTDSKALTPTINELSDAQIPILTYLIDAPDSKRLTYITSELEPAGEKAAAYIAQLTAGKGKVIISLAQAGNEEQEARARGIANGIRQQSGMSVLARVEDKYDPAVGSEQLKTLLGKNKDVVAILGCNSQSANGAVVALKELGYKPGQVKVAGWDYDESILDHIESGWVQVSVAQNSEFMGYLAFTLLDAVKNGSLTSQNGKRNLMPIQITVPTVLVTKENCSTYRR